MKISLTASLIVLVSLSTLGAADSPSPAPEHPAGDITFSPFGIGSCYTNNRSAKDNARWIPQMAAIGLHILRTPETGWGPLEPQEGKFTWDDLDAQIKQLEEQQFTFGAILAGNARWNKKDKPGYLPVNNLPGWSNYVTELVKHLNGKAKYFEVWNEPPNFIGKGQTASDYAKIVVSAYDAAHAADPKCLVGLCAKSVHVNWLEQTIKAGAKDHFDYIVLHPYEVLGVAVEHVNAETVYMNIVPTVRKMLAAQNPEKANVPIIFTELGFDAGKGAARPAQSLVKAYTMGIAQGVACIQWFEGMDGDSGPMGLIDGKGKPRPAYVALGQMIEHLGQKPTYLGWTLSNEKDIGFVFQGAKGHVLITWAPVAGTDTLKFAEAVQIVDPITGKSTSADSVALTNSPVMILGVADKVVADAKANKSKPLPWGGDYTNAESVSVTFGTNNVEKGLHTQSAETIAKDVLAYGGSARSGGVPGGNVFMVDPGFLTYSPTPFEVSIVVRRNEANDNAGFKFVYESTTGYKNFGWYTVPDNKEWHTIKWKVTDAQFVSMWGYNFALDSDGNQYNKYDIQSVTVTKLAK